MAKYVGQSNLRHEYLVQYKGRDPWLPPARSMRAWYTFGKVTSLKKVRELAHELSSRYTTRIIRIDYKVIETL